MILHKEQPIVSPQHSPILIAFRENAHNLLPFSQQCTSAGWKRGKPKQVIQLQFCLAICLGNSTRSWEETRRMIRHTPREGLCLCSSIYAVTQAKTLCPSGKTLKLSVPFLNVGLLHSSTTHNLYPILQVNKLVYITSAFTRGMFPTKKLRKEKRPGNEVGDLYSPW